MYNSLKNTFQQILKIPNKEWIEFETILKMITIEKNDFLLQQGEVCEGIYFLEKGIVRTFYLNDGKEINTSFNFDTDFLREIESLSHNQPSKNYIQALQQSKLILIEKNKLQNLYQKSIIFQELGRKILEQLAITEQKHSLLLAANSPKERYLYILENQPNIVQHIPLQYIASYLGISRESLSRIRKRI